MLSLYLLVRTSYSFPNAEENKKLYKPIFPQQPTIRRYVYLLSETLTNLSNISI